MFRKTYFKIVATSIGMYKIGFFSPFIQTVIIWQSWPTEGGAKEEGQFVVLHASNEEIPLACQYQYFFLLGLNRISGFL